MFIFQHACRVYSVILHILEFSTELTEISHTLLHTVFDRLSKDVLYNNLFPLVQYYIPLIAEVITVIGKASFLQSFCMWWSYCSSM